jgi:hypothetical protein
MPPQRKQSQLCGWVRWAVTGSTSFSMLAAAMG